MTRSKRALGDQRLSHVTIGSGKARPAPRLRSEQGRLRGFGLRAELFSTELARAWCGPGAGLAILLSTGMQLQSCCGHRIASFLHHTQDCPGALPSGLEPFLPEHSLVMEPADRLRRACLGARVEGQVMPRLLVPGKM